MVLRRSAILKVVLITTISRTKPVGSSAINAIQGWVVSKIVQIVLFKLFAIWKHSSSSRWDMSKAEEQRARANARKREKYANDPEYRARKNERDRRRLADRRANDPEFQRQAQAYRLQYKFRDTLKERYGLTIEEYEKLFHRQGGKCPICERPLPQAQQEGLKRNQQACVDHDHATGMVRG